MNARELTVLLVLDGREPESQQQTASRLGVDRTTMVGLLDGLDGKGLVTRQADAGDRRRNVVGVTDAGQRTLDKAKAASEERPIDDSFARSLRRRTCSYVSCSGS